MDSDRQRPTTNDEEIERTGRTEQVIGKDDNQGLGVPGSRSEHRTERDENDPGPADDTDELRGGGA